MVPYTSNFYPNHLTHLKFYTEIYNTDKVIPGQSFLVRYSVKSYETKQVVASLSNFSKQTAKPVNVVLGVFPIDKLPSGNYHLTIEVVDKTNKLLDQRRIFFQRSNQLSPLETIISVTLSRGFTLKFDKAQIQEYVKCLSPISSEMELVFAQNALGSNDSTIMQKYFQAFWEKRNTEEPESEWSKYFKNVKIAEKLYGTRILNGFETDRGRVYLKYGLPNDKVISDFETYAYPYELWQYNKAGNQSNVKFVFYNPDMVTNDYQLIHSDVIGEIRNRGWKTLLYGRSHYSTDFDDSGDLGKQYGDRSHDLFDD
ncbi:MAG: GWxTD domain-containing protein [Bacteroidia bacterium]|nr:GWxTD domain-containing protein [Bacteroidia bacterium]